MNSNMIARRQTLAVWSNGIKSEPMMLTKCFSVDIIHLMSDPEGNSQFCFPESPYVSLDEVEGNIRARGKQN